MAATCAGSSSRLRGAIHFRLCRPSLSKFAGSTVLPEDPLAHSDVVFVVVLRWCAETKALQPSRLGSPQEP
eukprot:COSAG04_NODE_27876_length_279_cov_0.655556_1_plen_70_part_10